MVYAECAWSQNGRSPFGVIDPENHEFRFGIVAPIGAEALGCVAGVKVRFPTQPRRVGRARDRLIGECPTHRNEEHRPGEACGP